MNAVLPFTSPPRPYIPVAPAAVAAAPALAPRVVRKRPSLGASSAAAAVGASPWKTPFELYQELLGEAPAFADDDNQIPLEVGIALEPIVIRMFERETGLTVSQQQKRFRDPTWGRRHVTVDGIASDGAGVEAKTTGWLDPEKWGSPHDDDAVPLHYYFQCQHHMACTGSTLVYVPLLVSNRDFRIYRVVRSDDVIHQITVREKAFVNCLNKRTPPPLVTLDDCTRCWPSHVADKIVQATENMERKVALHAELRRNAKLLQEKQDAIRLDIQTYMQDAEVLVGVAGEKLATWKQNKTGKRFNQKRFAAENPEIYAQYLDDAPGARPFLNKL